MFSVTVHLITAPVDVMMLAAAHVLTGQTAQVPVTAVSVDTLGNTLPVGLNLQTNELLTTTGL